MVKVSQIGLVWVRACAWAQRCVATSVHGRIGEYSETPKRTTKTWRNFVWNRIIIGLARHATHVLKRQI